MRLPICFLTLSLTLSLALSRALLLAFSLTLALFSGLASAEQFKALDHYQVHYSAINSTFLTAEVAKTYSISRSKVSGLVNVAVLDTRRQNAAVTARVTGTFTNLIGQIQALEFKQVREGKAIYYISEFRFTDDEILSFDLQIQPDPNEPAYPLRFKQHFYVD
ncbi:MAG: hypothetical protein ACI9W6_001193 [Motiliproteus sp.]|jgi:hypothetical protein